MKSIIEFVQDTNLEDHEPSELDENWLSTGSTMLLLAKQKKHISKIKNEKSLERRIEQQTELLQSQAKLNLLILNAIRQSKRGQ